MKRSTLEKLSKIMEKIIENPSLMELPKHMKISQKDTIKEKLIKEGKTDNQWAMKNYIWRLSHVIYLLRNEGMKITQSFKVVKGKKTKIAEYTLEK